KEVAGEQRGLLAAGARPDFDDDVLLVVGGLGDQEIADLPLQRIFPELQALPLLLGQRPQLWVLALLDELLRRRQILHYPLIFPVRLHDGCKRSEERRVGKAGGWRSSRRHRRSNQR